MSATQEQRWPILEGIALTGFGTSSVLTRELKDVLREEAQSLLAARDALLREREERERDASRLAGAVNRELADLRDRWNMAETKLAEAQREIERLKAEKLVSLCVCANGDNPAPDCPCVICTVRRAEARVAELEASCARKDAALREIAVGRTAADLGCGVAVDTMTAARLCQIARAALAEAAPAAGETITAAAILTTGCSHAACLSASRQGPAQGFITSAGRFVDRVEALRIATAAGQLEGRTKHRPLDMLMSEDLWDGDLAPPAAPEPERICPDCGISEGYHELSCKSIPEWALWREPDPSPEPQCEEE